MGFVQSQFQPCPLILDLLLGCMGKIFLLNGSLKIFEVAGATLGHPKLVLSGAAGFARGLAWLVMVTRSRPGWGPNRAPQLLICCHIYIYIYIYIYN